MLFTKLAADDIKDVDFWYALATGYTTALKTIYLDVCVVSCACNQLLLYNDHHQLLLIRVL